MNSENNTVVSGEFYKKLKEAGLDAGYREVPESLRERMEKKLAGRDIADIDEPTKGDLKREAVREGNRKHEEALRKGRESEIVKAQLAQRESR